jgi:dTDP-4-dehydrorhamnose reductase
MKKILILGGSGMLGHKAYQVFSKEFEVWATFRQFDERLRQTNIFDASSVLIADAFDFESVKRAIDAVRPDVVLNCIGIIKQTKEAKQHRVSIYINSLFPHLVAEYCDAHGAKLIHISTDCVFSGKKGNYTELDPSDAEDLYGKTKFLGEVSTGNALTLRTSIIGNELFTTLSLLDWFLSQDGKTVNGYTNAIYTGFTNLALCAEIKRIILNYPNLSGLYQVSSEKINKFELLLLIKEIYGLNISVVPFADFHCDRSLNSAVYRQMTNFQPPTWHDMITNLHKDKRTTYSWKILTP